MTVQSVPPGQDPATVHPWLLSSALDAAVVVTPEQAGAASHAGADTPLRLYTARAGEVQSCQRNFAKLNSARRRTLLGPSLC